MNKLFNEQRFEYHASYGTIFKCSRNDFKESIIVTNKFPISIEQLLQDVAEMSSYHRAEIHPKLNGFSGYDTLNITLKRISFTVPSINVLE